MLQTKCPYCFFPEMPEPELGPHPHATCPNCGKRPRAEITPVQGGPSIVRYVREGFVGVLSGKRQFRPTPEQAARLDAEPNESKAIRDALDMYYGIIPAKGGEK